jgi:beta-galactosidase
MTPGFIVRITTAVQPQPHGIQSNEQLERNMYASHGVRISLLVLMGVVLICGPVWSQPTGGISFKNAIIITPDASLNAALASGAIPPTAVADVRVTTEGLVVNPILRPGWTWVAAKGISVGGAPLSFVFADGRLYSDVMLKTMHRRMKFTKDVSDQISGNGHIWAWYRENVIERELVIFAYRRTGGVDSLTVGAGVFGAVRSVPISYERSGFGFAGVLRMAEEFRPWFIETAGEPPRYTQRLNDGWIFRKGEVRRGAEPGISTRGWEQVTLPHCWNAKDVFDGRNTFDGFEHNSGYYRGPGWYRKVFTLNEHPKGQRVWIEFEGAFQRSDVWINGHFLGTHRGGYTGFSFDITQYLSPGRSPNLLAVRVDNAFDQDTPPHTADYAMYGGLYRDVFLTVTGPVRINGVPALVPTAGPDGTGRLAVEAAVGNTGPMDEMVEVKCIVVNSAHEIVASFGQAVMLAPRSERRMRMASGEIRAVDLWSTDRPALYTIHTQILRGGRVLDEMTDRIGFRWFAFDPDSGFSLNGRALRLKGVNRHQEYPMLGIALPDSLHVRDMALIKELGANVVRLAHYPQDPSVLAACDSLGLLVWEEIPVVNSVGGAAFARNALTMMQEMIERDRNRPSVILWGLGNECLTDYAEAGAVRPVTELLRRLHAFAKELDPTRLTTQAHNDLRDESAADITDVMGRNRYYGWYTPHMEDLAAALDQEHEKHPRRVLFISEYGAESKRGYHVAQPTLFDHSEEYQLKFHEYYWKTISSRPFVCGSTIWTAFDFASPFKIGNIPRVNQKGIWDAWRRPKDLYYFYKAQWTSEPMVYIVSHTRTESVGEAGSAQEVKVYSNCDEVELTINGVSAGKQRSSGVFRWSVLFRSGVNVLEAEGRSGRATCTDRLSLTVSSK